MQRHALRVTFFFLILLLTSILVPSIEASLTWNTQQVKEYVWEGGNCPIAIDQSGITHIAYLDGYTLVYASYNGREWTNETIATDAIYLIFDLILDSKGYPHILYEKKFEGPLRIANWDGQVWSIQDTGVSYSDIAALAVDSLGNPSIIYTTFTTNINHDDWAKNTVNTSLIYARWTGTDWDTQIIDTVLKDSLSAISIALSNKSAPYILYSPSSNLNIIKLATSQDSKWRIQDASSEASAGNCGKIVLDSKGYVHFLCTQPYQNSSSLRTILYATFDLTTWSTQTVTSGIEVGTVANLVLDSQDNPHFTFRIYEGDSMYVAFSGDRWQIEKSPVDIGAGNLALDYSGNPHLLYRTGSPARYCSHLIYASAIAGNATSLTSNVPDNTILEVTLAAVVILTIIVIATALQRNRLKNRRKINT